MTRLRRLALALLFLHALQLLVPGAAGACDRVVGATPSAAVPDEHEGHHMPAPDDAEGGERQQLPAHCPAAASCTIAALASIEVAIDPAGAPARQEVVVHDGRRPRSIGEAPETPPPRG